MRNVYRDDTLYTYRGNDKIKTRAGLRNVHYFFFVRFRFLISRAVRIPSRTWGNVLLNHAWTVSVSRQQRGVTFNKKQKKKTRNASAPYCTKIVRTLFVPMMMIIIIRAARRNISPGRCEDNVRLRKKTRSVVTRNGLRYISYTRNIRRYENSVPVSTLSCRV